MASETLDLNPVLKRLSKLERQNQQLKSMGIVALVAFSAIFLMGQMAPFPHIVEAQKFILKDKAGNVRGWIGTIGKGSELSLGNDNAQPMMRLVVSTDSSDLHFYGNRKSGMNLGVDSGIPDISMAGAEGNGAMRITFHESGPNLILEDANGFATILGAMATDKRVASNDHGRSAASIILLNKDKKIVWQAP